MSAYYEVLFLGWLLLLETVVLKNIEAASATQSTRNNNQPSKVIATDDGSICTTNGVDYVLFLDQSQLDEANSKKHSTEAAYEKVAMGFCQTQCNLVCASENLPVCAIDSVTGLQRTFNNPCEMSRDACLNNIEWKLQATGPCSAIQERTNPILIEPKSNPTKKGRKPVSCIKVFNPVCAIFAGVKSTFSNECLVNAENVKTGNDWTIFSHGVCEEDYGSFGYNADQIKYNNIRSFDKTIQSFDKQREANQYYDEMMTFIYAPPTIQNEYIDEIFAQNPWVIENPFYDPTTMLENTYSQHQFRYPLSTETTQVPTEKIRIPRVNRCKYGSEPICGAFKNRYHSFDNVCDLMLRNILLNQTWTKAYAGNCIKKNCPQVCTENYAPICVSKNDVNVTVLNTCYLDIKQCQDPESTWKILAKGECEKNIAPSLATTSVSKLSRKYEHDELDLRTTKKYPAIATVASTSSISDKPTTTTKTLALTTTSTNVPPTTASTTITSTTTTTSPTTTTTTTTTTTPRTTTTTIPTTTTTASQSTARLSFDIKKSMTTPKHYISLTTSETTKTTTPATTYVISAKITPSRTSIYGANRNSVIMRLVKAKGFTSPKYSSAHTL